MVPADAGTPTRKVQFFHDSMQSYLTANGLWVLDSKGYGLNAPDEEKRQAIQRLLRRDDNPAKTVWDRSRIFLWAAAHPDFTKDRAGILLRDGAELFQMCLTTFSVGLDLRRWLRDELVKWARRHHENLRRRDVLSAVPAEMIDQVRNIKGGATILVRAADLGLAADKQSDTIRILGTLYAGIAPLVYELKLGESAGEQDSELQEKV